MLASKKISSKNQILPRLFWIKNIAKPIPYIYKTILSIFCILIFVSLDLSPNLAAKVKVIT